MEKFSTDMFNLVHIHFWIYLFGVSMMLDKEEIKSSINVHLFQLFSGTSSNATRCDVTGSVGPFSDRRQARSQLTKSGKLQHYSLHVPLPESRQVKATE